MNVGAHFFEMPQPAFVEVDVPVAEIDADQRELLRRLDFAQREGACDDVLDAGGVIRDEGAHDHAFAVGVEINAGGVGFGCGHGFCVPGAGSISACVISARER